MKKSIVKILVVILCSVCFGTNVETCYTDNLYRIIGVIDGKVKLILSDASTAVTTKIGMMYLSEYYYGATPYYWTFPGNNTNKNDYRKSINDNWMHIGLDEWTISRDSLHTNLTFAVSSSGNIGHDFVFSGVGGDIGEVIRPVFCLKSSV